MPHTHTTPIFILRHKLPGFSGVMLGVDFYAGRGTTSSASDAVRFLELGHTIEGEGGTQIRALAVIKKVERESRRKEQAELAAVEKRPAQTWKELLAGAAERRAERETEAEDAARLARKSERWKHTHNYYANQAMNRPEAK